jgi:hypothetical protein
MNGQQGIPGLIYVIVVVALLIIAVKIVLYQNREKYLIQKYGEDVGLRILSRHIWQGMACDQLEDSWGTPVDVDRVVYKTKTKETWKHNQTGKNRFKDRIYLEGGTVVGWKD